jgi:hypothetical protein
MFEQLISYSTFFGRQDVSPGLLRLSHQNVFKSRKVGVLSRCYDISQVEPFMTPALDGFFHREVEVINLLSNDKADATNNGRAVVVIMALDIEDFPP